VSSSQWLSTVSISRSIFPASGTTDLEQPIIRIRLYREGGRYVESANKKMKKRKEKYKQEKRRKKNTKKEKREKRIQKKRKRKGDDTCTIANEQPSKEFRKVLGYRSS
jgi:F0F1-type ATP synthase membrane subunit b/b'